MQRLHEAHIHCPYCGEPLTVLIDNQDQGEQYIEDCQVCCRPIVFHITEDMTGDVSVGAYREDDSF